MRMSSKIPNIMEEINRKLIAEGLHASCTELDKLYFLWQKLQETEHCLDSERTKFADERKEFDGYVELITKLSDEREAIALECETENKELQASLEELSKQLASYQSTETSEMLIQQGFDDIATRSTTEQIAYLLVDRARLMDEIEAEQARCYVPTADGGALSAQQLYTLLMKERTKGSSDRDRRGSKGPGSGGTDLGMVDESSWNQGIGAGNFDKGQNGWTGEIGVEGGRVVGGRNAWKGNSSLDSPRRSVGDASMSLTKMKNLGALCGQVDELELMNDLLQQRLKSLSPNDYNEVIAEVRRRLDMINEDDDEFTQQENVLPLRTAQQKQHPAFVAPKSLEEAVTRLEAAEARAFDADQLSDELRLKSTELQQVKRRLRMLNESGDADSLDGDNSLATGNGGGGGGLSKLKEAEQLRKTSDGLQKMLSSVETQLQLMREHTASGGSAGQPGLVGGADRKALTDQLEKVQREFERIKAELIKMMEKYNQQYRKYTDHKLASKNKLFKAKEGFKLERIQLSETIEKLENEMTLIKVTLDKELEYKENMEKSHHNLLVEQRELLSRLSEQEEAVQDQMRMVATLRVRCEYLEQENTTLNQNIETLSRQRHGLDKLVKEQQLLSRADKTDILRINTVSLSRTTDANDDPAVTINSIDTATFQDGRQFLETLLSPRSSPRRKPPTSTGEMTGYQTVNTVQNKT